jgi:segregation and condensation protein A
MEKWTAITLDDFNGPLDLLLHLIKEKDMDLMQINLVEITNQYLAYLHQFEELDVEIASEYLITASHLIELKSKMLLPKQEIEIVDGYEDGVDNLVNRLIEYHKIKEAVGYFKTKQIDHLNVFAKDRSIIKVVKINDDELPLVTNQINIDKFAKIFLRVIEKNELKNKATTTITATELSPEQVAKDIMILLQENEAQKTSWTLEELLEHQGVTLQMMLALFMSILDLAKNGIIHIEQNDDNIIIHKIKGENGHDRK